jgi:phage head maturation protease
MDTLNKQIYAEFTKRNDDEHIVEGWASSEALDSQGEVVKLEAIEKALPDYMKYANVRQMHQWSAVGKAVHASIDTAKKGLHLVAKIVDKEAWEKVKEGVYNGFSIGGRILKRVDNIIEELTLNEISLVDRPANPEAVFTMVKIDETAKEPMELSNPEVLIAGHVLDLARELRMLIDAFQSEGKSVKELSNALTNLKNLAVKTLSEGDKKKFDKILYEMDFNEMDKLTKIPQQVAEKVDIKNYVDTNWSGGYFEQLRKILR